MSEIKRDVFSKKEKFCLLTEFVLKIKCRALLIFRCSQKKNTEMILHSLFLLLLSGSGIETESTE